MTTDRIHLDGRKWASLALIPFALILIVIMNFLDIRAAADPPLLVAILNTVFTGIIPLAIAFIAFRSHRTNGSASLLMLGSGMLIFGLGQVAAGWTIGVYGANISATISNVCLFFSGCFNLGGALLAFTRWKTPRPEGHSWKIAGLVSFVGILFAVLTILAIAGLTPAFFVTGSGPTVIRQVVLSYAVAFLALASLLLFSMFTRNRDDFFFWYSIALATIAIGFIGVFLTSVMGSPVNWVARGMLYLGSVFALVAVIGVVRQARARGFSLEEALGRFFTEAEAGYRLLVETATDAIVVFDSADRVIVWNRAAEKMFGFTAAEATGSLFTDLAISEESAGVIRNNFTAPATTDADSSVHKTAEITARRRDGSTFPAEVSLSRHRAGGSLVSTCVLRDLTERKEAEAQAARNAKTLSELIERSPFGVYVIDSQFRIAMMNAGSQEGAFRNVRPIIGRPFSEAMHTLWPDEVAEEIIGYFRHTLETGEPYFSPGFTNPRHDVEIVESYEWELHRMTLPDGGYGVICYYYDSTQLRNTEQALRESEERFHNLFSAMPSGVAIYDVIHDGNDPDGKDFIFKDMNPAGEKTDHVHREEIIGKSLFDFFPLVQDMGLVEVFQRVWRTGVPEYFPVTLYEDDKISLWVTNYVWRLPSGELVALFEDITESKRIEDALRESEEKFRVLTQNLQSAVALIDEHGAFSIVNASFLRMFGIPADADIANVNSQDWAKWQVFNEDGTQLDVDQHPVRKAALTGMAVKSQLVAMKSPYDPELKWLLISAEPILDVHGGIHRIICTYYDITDRKHAEERLVFQANLLANISDVVYATDPEMRLTFWNSAAEKLYGWKEGEVLGKPVFEYVGSKLDPGTRDALRQELLEKGSVKTQVEHMTRDGTRLVFDSVTLVLYDPAGRVNGFVGVNHDITDRKRAEEEVRQKNINLNALNEELTATQEELKQNIDDLGRNEEGLRQNEERLKAALAEKEVLLAEIHHRVKNNLTAFISLLALEGSVEETPAGLELKKDLQNRARSMALIHETLYKTHQFSEVDMDAYLTPLIDQVVNSYASPQSIKTLVVARGVALDLARATPIGLIVNELVTNSLKHAFPQGGKECRAGQNDPCTIGVRLMKEDGSYILSIYDNGVGLPAGFDPTTAKTLGLKLVTFLAKHQVRAKIEVKSEKGTEFVFRFKE